MIKIAICDDEPKITSQIEKLILDSNIPQEFDISIFFSGESLYQSFCEYNNYDILFLDVEMSCENGIETAHKIREINKSVKIIYITAYVDFAPSAFEVNAFRFMSKPIDKNLFLKYFNLALADIIKKADYFKFSFNRENFAIPFNEIIYFESMKRLTYIHSSTGEEFKCYVKIGDIYKFLKDNNIEFYRLSQSILVNPDFVYSYKNEKMILKNNEEFAIAKSKRNEVNHLFCKIKGGEIIV